MGERFFYRASPDLAADLRQYGRDMDAFVNDKVKPFIAEHPDHEPVQSNLTQKIIGFRDGNRQEPPPAGLSRSQRRDYLIPQRGRAGDAWHAHMVVLNERPTLESVLTRHVVPYDVWRPDAGKVFLMNYADFGGDDVLLYIGCELRAVPPTLTPIPRSEGYAIQERWQEVHHGA